ncbi:hypothetical protein B0181_07060 [Moraxella caviae]|uniref:Protein of uncharacterized function (DUF2628) n=1 Tax=Moraxella caviae TaxID=34060 RepID=A0A1T0A105_9GAMM|nr:DUF2628 domain-containing protein [Moraxella caviae]OOR89432.1 hypothetical protein B0181_07060 [Moraxella caviae]STZ09844.1 Protein of uncharacterised function (DUF2628) [Moraxella caviae]VEW13080.1 Protein of uncharacterised function (DUF2628) [Moraxella caviae]
MFLKLPFLEQTTPPPFYQAKLSATRRTELDRWFIGTRSQAYYLRQFAEFDRVGRLHARWNWAAFFSTFGWLLYRKRYLDCVVYCVAGWSFIKVNIAIILAAFEFLFIGFFPEAWHFTVRVLVGGTVWLFWASMVARWADAYYYRMARREIADVLELYPNAPDEQRAHLRREGGVSLVGLGCAFAMFGLILATIVLQFVPIIATQKEQAVIFESYQAANAAQKRVSYIYEQQGKCPVGMPISSRDQAVSMQVVGQVAGVRTDCAIIATVKKAHYPVRYLNGENLTLYRAVLDDGQVVWRCQTSLNKKQTPRRCIG